MRPLVLVVVVACGGARTTTPQADDARDVRARGGVADTSASAMTSPWWCFESVFGVQCPGTETECAREAVHSGRTCFQARHVWCLRYDDEDGSTPEHCSASLASCEGYERFLASFGGGLPIVERCAAGSADGP